MLRGKEDIVMFRFRLAKEQVYKAITLTLFALVLIILATMMVSATESHAFLPKPQVAPHSRRVLYYSPSLQSGRSES